MKKHFKYLLLFVQLIAFYELNGQTKFINYFCEIDTQFNGKEVLARQTLVKKAIWSSEHSGLGSVQLKGVTQGVALSRVGNFKYFESNNVKTFNGANIFTTHNVDSLGKKSSYLNITGLEFNIGKDPLLLSEGLIPFGQNLNPIPVQLGKIVLGVTNFQSLSNRGNLFFSEQYALNNNQLLDWKIDTNLNNFNGIFPEVFSNDKTDYKTLISNVNRVDLTGWLIEMDRVNNTFQNRRFDLGRSPRKDFLVKSVRNSSSITTGTVNSTLQILGFEELNVLLRTELNNGVQEFYVYSETPSFGSNWTLLNEVVGGNIQQLERAALMNLFGFVLESSEVPVTFFLNLTDVEVNSITNTMLLVSPGGKVNLEEFKSKYGISRDLIFASYLTPLLENGVLSDKIGHLIEIDNNDVLTFTKQGFIGDNGKFVSNVQEVSFINISLSDDDLNPVNTSYAILTENVFDNSLGQNPSNIKQVADLQSEVYLVNLDGLSENNKIDIGNKKFQLFQTLSKGSQVIPAKYTEAYHPFFYVEVNNQRNVDSLCGIRGFADFYINPVLCVQQNNIEEFLELENVKNYVYPNPLRLDQGFDFIKWKHPDRVHIYTLEGLHLQVSDYGTEMNLNSFKSGVYVLRGENGWNQLLVIE